MKRRIAVGLALLAMAACAGAQASLGETAMPTVSPPLCQLPAEPETPAPSATPPAPAKTSPAQGNLLMLLLLNLSQGLLQR